MTHFYIPMNKDQVFLVCILSWLKFSIFSSFFPRIFNKMYRSNEKWYTFIIKLNISSYVSCCNSFSLFLIVFWLISHRVISIKEWLRLEVHFLVSFIFQILLTIYSLFIYIYIYIHIHIYIHMHKHTYNITSTFFLKSIFNLMILLLLWSILMTHLFTLTTYCITIYNSKEFLF